jgi:hypothetical protein
MNGIRIVTQQKFVIFFLFGGTRGWMKLEDGGD